MRKALVWQVVGGLCYLVGMVVFLSVAIGVFMAPPTNSLANLSTSHTPALLGSAVLLVVGRLISYRFGTESGLTDAIRERHGHPDKSKLEELGYVIPPESEDGGGSGEPQFSFETGELTVACRECGAENDPDFRFCGNCSAELPD